MVFPPIEIGKSVFCWKFHLEVAEADPSEGGGGRGEYKALFKSKKVNVMKKG